MNRTTIALLMSALTLWAIVAGVGARADRSAKAGPTAQVRIGNFSFAPETLTVKAGATVYWSNQDDVPHTVVSTAKEFSSKVLDTDDNYAYTFRRPGAYEYYCSIHPHMTGKIIVQ